jgi:endogenous inhibitor of DNA gyrase (YacG/DUF329 family)
MIRPRTCPVCDRELPPNSATDSPLFPFCSLRCRQIDLWRWCEGKHAVVERLTPDELLEKLIEQRPAEDQ